MNCLKFTPLEISGAFLVETQPQADDRGSFSRLYCAQEFAAAGLDIVPSQISLARSAAAFTLRGLHYLDAPRAEAKLVRCLRGRIQEVVADVRPASPTFRRWMTLELDHCVMQALFVPPGCAQGYLTLEGDCDVLYHMDRPHAPGFERGIRWNDPAFGVKWRQPPAVIHPRDAAYADFDRR